MSKKNIPSLISTIETQLDALENPSLDIESSIAIYSETLSIASELSKKLKQTDQKINVLSEKQRTLLKSLEDS
jgi:exodeoxyribonuclease VII small subunit